MDTFVHSDPGRRRMFCEEAGERLRLAGPSVEKDFWICWTLRKLFALADIGDRLTFKGGTSLSKAWRIIERFSENIDLVIDRDVLGFGGEESPEKIEGSNKQKRQLEQLKEASRTWIAHALLPAFTARIPDFLRQQGMRLETDPDEADRQSLLLWYPAAFEAGSYLRPAVKLELGARSDIEPAESTDITPYLAEAIPEPVTGSGFSIRTVRPERTFARKLLITSRRRDAPTPPRSQSPPTKRVQEIGATTPAR